jgi:hypothetical protein
MQNYRLLENVGFKKLRSDEGWLAQVREVMNSYDITPRVCLEETVAQGHNDTHSKSLHTSHKGGSLSNRTVKTSAHVSISHLTCQNRTVESV